MVDGGACTAFKCEKSLLREANRRGQKLHTTSWASMLAAVASALAAAASDDGVSVLAGGTTGSDARNVVCSL